MLMAFVFIGSSLLTRVAVLCLIYGFSSNNEFHVSGRKSRVLGPRYVWPNATIPYVLDCSIANVVGARAIIKAAMAEWEKRTCIRFVKRTNQEGYLLIRRQKGCWSEVGYKERRTVLLSMGDGCEYNYVMMHELGHVIGFYHEHQRKDRDEFIDILWDNVVNSMLKQFFRRPNTDHMDTELPYDTSSIMHYQFAAFAKNASFNTIAVKDKNSTTKPTPYSYITDLDVRKTREMYNCPANESKSNKTELKNKDETMNDLKEENSQQEVEVVEAVEVSLMSPGWFVTSRRDRTASIMVNGKEMARNMYGLNVVVFNYLSGRRVRSSAYSVSYKNGGRLFSNFIKSKPGRNYFLIVSKAPSLSYINEARSALKDIGIRLPRKIARGSSLCIVGYKGKENVSVKYVIGSRNKKASFLSMNITLASEFTCQNDVLRCQQRTKGGRCRREAWYYMKNCQKTCGSCKKGKPCEDENENCERWAKKRSCYSHPAYMLKYCKVSCKVCRKALPAARVKNARSGRKRKIVVLVDDSKKRVRKYTAENDDDKYDGRVIGVRCKDKSKTCPVWAKVGRCKTDSWVIRHCLSSCDIKGSCDREEIKPIGECSKPFGIGWHQTLPDERFAASSVYITGEWNASASNARLYMEDDFKTFRIGSWCSKYPPKQGEWLKIDLGEMKRITAVATQGRFRFYEHVKTYKLSFSKDAKKWTYYKEDGIIKEFKGNCDHVSPVLNILDTDVKARYVQFHPIKFYEGICMRVEVYGCRW